MHSKKCRGIICQIVIWRTLKPGNLFEVGGRAVVELAGCSHCWEAGLQRRALLLVVEHVEVGKRRSKPSRRTAAVLESVQRGTTATPAAA